MGTTCGRQSEQIFCTCAGDWIRGTADGTRTHELYEFDMGSILHGQLWRVVTWILHRRHRWMFWNLISVLCAYVGQFAGIHAWNIPHECILWGSVILCDIVGAIVYVVTRILLGYGFLRICPRIIF